MSSFTTVIANGIDIQFKTGGDNCDTYNVGDVVAWWVDPNYVGKAGLLDGVYDGYSGDAGAGTWGNWWVCIHDHRIVEVVEWLSSPEITDGVERVAMHVQQREELRQKYGIPEEQPRELWTPAAWEQHDESEELSREQTARDVAAGVDCFNAYTRRKLREPGFMRQIMRDTVEPTELTRKDGVVLRRGETYQHFGRSVVLDRIYDNGYVGVKHPKGSHRLLPPEELTGDIVANKETDK